MSRQNWLPDFVKRSREKAKGDVIAADVGEGSRGVAVGKNIIQIGTIQIPRWAIVAVVLSIAGIAALLGYRIFAPTPVSKMTGSFNVAVAEFRVEGHGAGVDGAERLILDFANAVDSTVKELAGAVGKIDFRPPLETGQIAGADSEARAENARTLAQQIGADVVVYGVVSVDGEKATIRPEFIINESVNDGLVEASEITGQYEMGHPLLVERISNRDLRDKTATELRDRFHALTFIIDGLSAYVVGDYGLADKNFSEAVTKTLTLNALDNREVLYVMRGNALLNQGLLKEDPSFFTDAEEYYGEAKKANSKYSRAYVGLATVLYERARSEGGASGDYGKIPPELLDESIRTYQQALQPDMERPPLADVESKVNFGLGQAYLLKALVLQYGGQPEQASELLSQALQAYQKVIDEYQGASPESQARLKERTAHAYARIGFIYRVTNHLAEAEQQYVQALEWVPELTRTQLDRARYEAALGDVKVRQGKLQDAKSWYEKAAALASDGSAEKTKYQEIVAKIQAQIDEGAKQ